MTALRALEKFDGVTASNILASLVMAETNPGVGAARQFLDHAQEGREVLDELKAQLKLGDFQGAEARTRLLQELTRQIYDLSMAGKNTEEVLARAGTTGRLSPSLYRVAFDPNFQRCVELGTRESHVVDAIRRPDDVQHVNAGELDESFSIFLKFHPNAEARRAFWLIVYAHRAGRTLVVQNAYRAFVDEVDLSVARQPIDVLRAFSEKFGLEVQAGTQQGRFIFNADVPLEPGKMIRTYTVKGVRHAPCLATMSGHNLGNVHRVVIAYAIDLLRYESSLNGHGVRTRLKHPPLPDKDELEILVASDKGLTKYEVR